MTDLILKCAWPLLCCVPFLPFGFLFLAILNQNSRPRGW